MGKKDKSANDMTRRFVSSVELIAAREGAAVLATQAPDAPPITLGKVTFDLRAVVAANGTGAVELHDQRVATPGFHRGWCEQAIWQHGAVGGSEAAGSEIVGGDRCRGRAIQRRHIAHDVHAALRAARQQGAHACQRRETHRDQLVFTAIAGKPPPASLDFASASSEALP